MFYTSFIDTVVEFASDSSGEKFEDVLKEAFPDFFEKTGDMGIEDEVAATLSEKCGSESANDNPGKYTDADYAKIQNLLELYGTKAEMNDIDQLDEYGIKPSDYESMGINAPERVSGAAEAIGTTSIEAINLTRTTLLNATEAEISVAYNDGTITFEEYNNIMRVRPE